MDWKSPLVVKQVITKKVDMHQFFQEEMYMHESLQWSFLYCLATRKHLYPFITKAYKEKQSEYIQAYLNSVYSEKMESLSFFTTNTKEMLIQTAGILSWADANKDYEEVFYLVQKGFKKTWNYIKQKGKFEIIEFIQLSMNGDIRAADEANKGIIIGMYTSLLKPCPCEVDPKKSSLLSREEFILAMNQVLEFMTNIRMSFDWETPKIKPFNDKKSDDAVKNRLQKWEIKKGMNVTLKEMIYGIRKKEGRAAYIGSPSDSPELRESKRKTLQQIVETGQTRTFIPLSNWLEVVGLEQNDLLDQLMVDYSQFHTLCKYVQWCIRDGKIKENEEELLTTALFIITALAEECSISKQKFFELKNREDEVLTRLNEKKWKEEIKAVRTELVKIEQEYQQQVKAKDKEVTELKDEVEKWKKKNELLQLKIEELNQPRKELKALQQYLIHLEKETPEHEEKSPLSFENIVEWLNEKNIVIIGGIPTWQRKLKELFPKFKIIHSDEIHRDLSFVDYADAVFLNTSVLSHTFYWKVSSAINENKTPIFYIGRNTNLELAVEEMFHLLTKYYDDSNSIVS